MSILIRTLDPTADLDAVEEFYGRAADYWILADRRSPDRQKALDFFTDCPPASDPAASHRLGMFEAGVLMGLAELSFDWPGPGDAFLGLQILAPEARGRGLGRALLAEVEACARASGAPALYLAVLDANPKGRAFWEREGFRDTGVARYDDETAHWIRRMGKPL